MDPISTALPSPAPLSGTAAPQQAPLPREAAERPSPHPAYDEYVPQEESPAASGRYWIGRDGDGAPKVFFDDPEAGEPEAAGRPAERCVCSTDQVDREIRQLREEQAQLEKQLRSETDEAARRTLERRLAQVTRELSQKDNDTYRRQHADFS